MNAPTVDQVHIERENELAVTLRCDFPAGSDSNARRVGHQLCEDYWRQHPGCAVTVQFDDFVYVRFALGRVKTWR